MAEYETMVRTSKIISKHLSNKRLFDDRLWKCFKVGLYSSLFKGKTCKVVVKLANIVINIFVISIAQTEHSSFKYR